MALNLKEVPDILEPVNNVIPIVYDSSFSDEDDFRYKIDLKENVSGNNILSLFVYPDTSNDDYMIYDPSRVLSDNVTTDITDNWNASGITSNPNSIYAYKFDITEYIGSTTGDTTTVSDKYTFRGVVQYGPAFSRSWYYGTYVCGTQGVNTPVVGQFLTNNRTKKLRIGDYATINALAGTFPGTLYSDWERVVYEVDGEEYYIEYTTNTTPSIYTLPVGPENLDDCITAGVLLNSTGGTQTTSIITSSTQSYTVHLEVDNSLLGWINCSNEITVNIDTDCSKFDGVEFIWLADLGSYDEFTFRMKDVKQFNSKKEIYRKRLHTIINDEYTYNIGDRGQSVFHVETEETNKVVSYWINDDDLNSKLMELYRSPEVYIVISDEIYPVVITTKKVQSKNVKNDKYYQHEIEYMFAYEKMNNL